MAVKTKGGFESAWKVVGVPTDKGDSGWQMTNKKHCKACMKGVTFIFNDDILN